MANNIANTGVLEEVVERHGPLTSVIGFFKKMLKVRLAGFGMVVIFVFAFAAIFAPWIAPYDPIEQHRSDSLSLPGTNYLLGTDLLGRDTLSRLIFGSRISLTVGLAAVSFAAAIGVPLGLISGYFGGWVDNIIMRAMDALFAFPALILAMAILAVLGPGPYQVCIAIGIVTGPLYARLTRAQVLAIREFDYIMAQRALGGSVVRILLRHILPNCFAPIIVQGTLGLAFAILTEASLSFLGVGVAPPTATWGGMLNDGFQYLEQDPWLSVFPGASIFLLVLGFNFTGDALRDVLDPKLGRSLGLR